MSRGMGRRRTMSRIVVSRLARACRPASTGILDQHELVCDGVPLAGDRRRRRHAALRLQRRAASRALPRHRRGLRRLSARAPLRAQGQLDARPSRGCCASSAAPPTPTPSGRSSWRARAGFAPADIVFTGVGKSAAELECAVPLGLKAINVESAGELARVEAIAARLGRRARASRSASIPDIDAKSHPHISTGLKINKFGMPARRRRASSSRRIGRPAGAARWSAIHVHVGSQITTLEPLRRAAALVGGPRRRAARRRASPLEYVDLGGGLGISYDGAAVPSAARLRRRRSSSEVRPTGLPIVIEPGRSIVGPAGALRRARRRPQAARRRRASSPSSTPA